MHPLQLSAQHIPYLVCLGIIVIYSFLTLLQVVLVIAFVDVDLAVIQLHHDVRHAVQEITIVSDHQQSASGMGEIVL